MGSRGLWLTGLVLGLKKLRELKFQGTFEKASLRV